MIPIDRELSAKTYSDYTMGSGYARLRSTCILPINLRHFHHERHSLAAPLHRFEGNWCGEPAHGVYMLDGDTFQFCYEHGSINPPAKFGAGPGSKNLLLIYKWEPRPEDKGKPGPGTMPPFIESRPWGWPQSIPTSRR